MAFGRGQSCAFATNRHPSGHCESEVELCCQVGEREALRAVRERAEMETEEGTGKHGCFPEQRTLTCIEN